MRFAKTISNGHKKTDDWIERARRRIMNALVKIGE